jgi:hypothetical protein
MEIRLNSKEATPVATYTNRSALSSVVLRLRTYTLALCSEMVSVCGGTGASAMQVHTPETPAENVTLTTGAAFDVFPVLGAYRISKLAVLKVMAYVSAETPASSLSHCILEL